MTEIEKPKEEAKGEKPKKPDGDPDEGDKPKTTPLIKGANNAAERLEKATAQMKEQLDRQEEIIAKQALGGTTEAGGEKKEPEKLSDKEYAEALERGEVNPMKEDGFT